MFNQLFFVQKNTSNIDAFFRAVMKKKCQGTQEKSLLAVYYLHVS